MSKITLILGHPDHNSFNGAIAKTYRDSALGAGHEVRYFALGEMNYDPILRNGYAKRQDLEPELQACKDAVLWADHLVFVYPRWWGATPSLLSGFFERVFLPGIAFKYHEKGPFWDQLLKGKSAHCFVTMDPPLWYYYLIDGGTGHRIMKQSILGFCGINPVKFTSFCDIRTSSDKTRAKWLKKVRDFAINCT